jgi:hypothetical protein
MNPDTNRFEPLRELVDNPGHGPGHQSGPGKGRDPAAEALAKLDAAKDLQRLADASASRLVRPDGSPVPAHWTVLAVGEDVVIKTHTFRVVHIGETYLVLEPVGPVLVGQGPG